MSKSEQCDNNQKMTQTSKFLRICLYSAASALCVFVIILGLTHLPFGGGDTGTFTTAPSNQFDCEIKPMPDSAAADPGQADYTDPQPTTEPADREHIAVKIWMSGMYMDAFVLEQIDRFNQENVMDIVIDATVECVECHDAANLQYSDPDNAADLYCFLEDDLIRLIKLDALTALSPLDAQWVKDNNLAFTVDTATYNDSVYAFPMSYQNATVLIYDKSVISPEQASTQEGIMAACMAADKKFCMDLMNPYVFSCYFLATGCDSRWYPDADGGYTTIVDNYNSTQGKFALMGLTDVLTSPTWITTDRNGMSSSIIWEEVLSQSAAVISTNTMLYGMFQEIVGENLAVTVLPTFDQYDETYQMRTYANSIMLGIRPQTDNRKAEILTELAKYLTSGACQMERYLRFYSVVPSNLAALELIGAEEPLIAAMVAQSQYAVPEMLPQVMDWWDAASDIIRNFQNDHTAEMALMRYGQWLEDMKDPPKGNWSVFGDMPESLHCVDIDMIEQEDGTWRTKEAVYIRQNDSFVIRYEHSWDIHYEQKYETGYGWWRPGAEGYYYIVFDPVTKQCTWFLQS